MTRAAGIVCLLLGLGGCFIPPSDRRPPVIGSLLDVQGDSVGFRYGAELRSGEVLGFRNDTTFILTNNEIYAVKESELRSLEKGRVDWAQPNLRLKLAELRRNARYPHGISPELEAVLVGRLKQTQVHR